MARNQRARSPIDVPERSLAPKPKPPKREYRCDQCGRIQHLPTCARCLVSIGEVAEFLRDHAGYSAEAVARAILTRYVLLERQSSAGQVLGRAGR